MNEFAEAKRHRTDSEERRMHEILYDPVTGLANRLLATDRLSQSLEQAHGSAQIAVVFIGVDEFEALRESRGQEAANDLLRQIAARLAEVARPTDSISRFGADEFVIVRTEIGEVYEAVSMTEEILAELKTPLDAERRPLLVTTSIGVAVSRSRSDRAEDLLAESRRAMFDARERGGGTYVIFDDALRRAVDRRLKTEKDLRSALDHDDLSVVYQPKADLRSGRVLGIEALARWRHPTRSWVSPLEFIKVAEDSGLIDRLGRFVLSQAVADASTLQARSGSPVQVCVNVSGRQLAEPTFPSVVEAVLHEKGMDPKQLYLEVTEGVLLEENSPGPEVLAGLKELGVMLSLDDFGTGYSSLAYLRRFPIDELKIDRAFVQELGAPNGDVDLVAAILGMGRALHLGVVAEGVEKTDQLAALVGLGCDAVQGFLIGAPQSTDGIAVLLESGISIEAPVP